MRSIPAVAVMLFTAFSASVSYAQLSPLLFQQDRDDGALSPIAAEDLAKLGDPLFNLVLKGKANLVKLADIISAIQGTTAQHQLFVVDEQIVSSAKTGSRRSVIAFSGNNGGEALDGNVMISVFFTPAGFAASDNVEAWGWDNSRQRYNYYKLDAAGSTDGNLIWKFRTSSVDADQKSVAERGGTCLGCHVSGAPVMKELFFPWNNWHAGVGTSFTAEYLVPGPAAPGKWPAASTTEFARLTGANILEDDFLKAALKRFSVTRLNTALKRDPATGNPETGAGGKMTVIAGGRLLRPVFETTDVNLYSSVDMSGIHPIGGPAGFAPGRTIGFPVDQFFLNTDLIAGAGEGELGGLGLGSARGFEAAGLSLTQQENKDLITKFLVRLNGVSGDAEFAWLVPGPSFSDNALIDQCLRQGVVTPHFLAAALAVDVENPVFSTRRAALLPFIPDQFDFAPVAAGVNPVGLPRDAANDLLTQAVLTNINAATPAVAVDSPAGEFRALLNSPDAVKELDKRVVDYLDRVKTKLDTAPANAAIRKAELERVFKLVIDRRNLMEKHPVLGNLDETQGKLLLPLAP
jgi:hypothetical protein